jgi:hypothetical protein
MPPAGTPCQKGRAVEPSLRGPTPAAEGFAFVPHARFLRVVQFQPGAAESAFDAGLRDSVVPRMVVGDAVVDVWVGRRGSREDRARVLVSTWQTDPEAEPDGPVDIAALGSLGEDVVAIDGIEQTPLSVHARFDRAEPTRILRVFHGQVRPGELDTYIDVARAGMLADAAAYGGLIAFALGARSADEFTTVTVWTGWPAIEAATGGNTRQPFMTRNAQLLAEFTVAHYEVLPDARDRGQERD